MVRDLGASLGSHARECEPDDPEDRALAALAMCVGGLGLARSVQDDALAERILTSCREQAAEILCGGASRSSKRKARRVRKSS